MNKKIATAILTITLISTLGGTLAANQAGILNFTNGNANINNSTATINNSTITIGANNTIIYNTPASPTTITTEPSQTATPTPQPIKIPTNITLENRDGYPLTNYQGAPIIVPSFPSTTIIANLTSNGAALTGKTLFCQFGNGTEIGTNITSTDGTCKFTFPYSKDGMGIDVWFNGDSTYKATQAGINFVYLP